VPPRPAPPRPRATSRRAGRARATARVTLLRMPLAEVVLEPALWEQANDDRRSEWKAAAHDLATEGAFRPGAASLRVSSTEQGVSLELVDQAGARIEHVSISRDALSVHVTEYADICRKLASDELSYGSPRFEALDMAKRVAHDEAGRKLEGLCRPLGIDHATGRRLFTLLFGLRVDTTKLHGAFGHRPIR
jgi:uncharacterized protein (UPF0262 family)